MLVLYTEDRMPFQRNKFMYDLQWSKQEQVRHGLRKWYRQCGRNSKGMIETLKKELRGAYKSECFACAEVTEKETELKKLVRRRNSIGRRNHEFNG
ncbi:hypothetical protein FF2_031635 [Malus domestica]